MVTLARLAKVGVVVVSEVGHSLHVEGICREDHLRFVGMRFLCGGYQHFAGLSQGKHPNESLLIQELVKGCYLNPFQVSIFSLD
ncbi:hypothetical protein SUGI_0460170 [Cryptomeria japonica]|nr:hypothetical protein SUGI_0460170 [Cryptomeria japonica]